MVVDVVVAVVVALVVVLVVVVVEGDVGSGGRLVLSGLRLS